MWSRESREKIKSTDNLVSIISYTNKCLVIHLNLDPFLMQIHFLID